MTEPIVKPLTERQKKRKSNVRISLQKKVIDLGKKLISLN